MPLPSPASFRITDPAPALPPHTARLAEERAVLRRVDLRRLSAIDQMYAYYGADLA